jgi:gas vesicle protein GvpA/GvpJ/GvpM family
VTPQRRRRPAPETVVSPTTQILERADASLLELVDHVLNKGVVLSGEVTLGLAGIDLIYVRLLALICAADRVSGGAPALPPKRRRNRRSTHTGKSGT